MKKLLKRYLSLLVVAGIVLCTYNPIVKAQEEAPIGYKNAAELFTDEKNSFYVVMRTLYLEEEPFNVLSGLNEDVRISFCKRLENHEKYIMKTLVLWEVFSALPKADSLSIEGKEKYISDTLEVFWGYFSLLEDPDVGDIESNNIKEYCRAKKNIE